MKESLDPLVLFLLIETPPYGCIHTVSNLHAHKEWTAAVSRL